ncbi:MAG: AEC family transporter [Pseudomonadota bacterium]
MLPIFSAIIPVFALIFVGNMLRRAPIFSDQFWDGLNKLGFYVLYPALLFATIYRADFGGLSTGLSGLVFGFALTVMAGITLAAWPMFKRAGLPGPRYSSVFQSTIRWNGFIALAVAEKLYPPEALAMVALVMSVIIIPIQLSCVTVILLFSDQEGEKPKLARKLATNPLLLAVAFALVARALPFTIPAFAMDTLDLVARSALGMGLLAIGAGLRLHDLRHPALSSALPIVLKLIALPALVYVCGRMAGLPLDDLNYLVLCACVPTAMNGYVLAKELGGDAPFYAAVATMQTAIAFISMPLVLAAAAALSGG